MNKEKGSSTIAIIAIVAVALMVGVWIGAEKEVVISEINAIPASFQKVTKMKKELKVEESNTEETTTETEVTE